MEAGGRGTWGLEAFWRGYGRHLTETRAGLALTPRVGSRLGSWLITPAITERSELVVLGSIAGAEEGKDYGEEGKPTNHTSNLTIKVERASSPDVSEAVVEFTRNPDQA